MEGVDLKASNDYLHMLFILIAGGWLLVLMIAVAACRMAAIGDAAMTSRTRGQTPMAKRAAQTPAAEPKSVSSGSALPSGSRRRASMPAIQRTRVPGAR